MIASWLRKNEEQKSLFFIASTVLILPISPRPWSLKQLAQRIGIKDFSKIFILKGLENGMLEEKEIINEGGNFSMIYSLNISLNHQYGESNQTQ